MSKKSIVILIIVAVVAIVGLVVGLGFCGLLGYAMSDINKTNKEFGSLVEVCYGGSVESAAPYSNEAGIHPAMGVSAYTSGGDMSPNPYAIPKKALAKTLAETELVVCMGDEERVLIDRCTYTDDAGNKIGILDLYGFEREVTLIEAKTGQTVAQETIQGTPPQECLDTEAFPKGDDKMERQGSKVSNDDVEEWVRPYVIIH
jgi:hypothetical protein